MRAIAVDDKPMPLRALERAIQQAEPGIEVVACGSAQEVLDLPDLPSYDVAFVDIDMPEKNGIQLARELKARHPRLNIVFATGYGEFMGEAFALHSSGYLMKPITAEKVRVELDNLRHPPMEHRDDRLTVQCFGDFEVFHAGRPLRFERAKTKELLAYLVDRRGAVVSLRTIEAVLWEESRNGRVSGSYLRTLVADLRRTLDGCGHGDALVRRYGEVGVDVTHVSCDYYDLLGGDPLALAAWRGEYMSQFSWAEQTKATLERSFAQYIP